MNLKNISNFDLLKQTKNLLMEERRITTEVLLHLREIEARNLFAELGFSSLYDYCTKELGYSESSAWRRISAMRLLKDVPEVEKKLLDGRVTVSTLSQVQSFLLQEKKQQNEFTKDEKLELLGQVEGLSTRETERILATISPRSALPDRERFISGDDVEIRFTASRGLVEKFNRLKGLLAHNRDTQSYAGLLEVLADLALKRLDPVEKYKRKTKSESKSSVKEQSEGRGPTSRVQKDLSASGPDGSGVDSNLNARASIQLGQTDQYVSTSLPAPKKQRVIRRSIPRKVHDEVWRRDLGKCTYVSPTTGRRCDATHGLEVDHIWPFALGGPTELDNLRLLCRRHNQLAAIKIFGKKKMNQYLSPPSMP
jgi:hypothetical protein